MTLDELDGTGTERRPARHLIAPMFLHFAAMITSVGRDPAQGPPRSRGLFVEDLPASKAFYQDVFGLDVVYEDEDSAVVRLDNVLINLLRAHRAPMLTEPVGVGGADGGARSLFTISVPDVDTTCAELRRHEVRILNGPVDRPWKRRTAAFADPAGNVWEVAQELP
jgi:catechol 2,3-dioxygenase-like lactoylglutathione lyase family enzyme